MQPTISSMIGYAIRATDGDLGKVDQFYFDDEAWTIRYVVVKTANGYPAVWCSFLRSLRTPESESGTLSVKLTGPRWAAVPISIRRGLFIVSMKSSCMHTINGPGEAAMEVHSERFRYPFLPTKRFQRTDHPDRSVG